MHEVILLGKKYAMWLPLYIAFRETKINTTLVHIERNLLVFTLTYKLRRQ